MLSLTYPIEKYLQLAQYMSKPLGQKPLLKRSDEQKSRLPDNYVEECTRIEQNLIKEFDVRPRIGLELEFRLVDNEGKLVVLTNKELLAIKEELSRRGFKTVQNLVHESKAFCTQVNFELTMFNANSFSVQYLLQEYEAIKQALPEIASRIHNQTLSLSQDSVYSIKQIVIPDKFGATEFPVDFGKRSSGNDLNSSCETYSGNDPKKLLDDRNFQKLYLGEILKLQSQYVEELAGTDAASLERLSYGCNPHSIKGGYQAGYFSNSGFNIMSPIFASTAFVTSFIDALIVLDGNTLSVSQVLLPLFAFAPVFSGTKNSFSAVVRQEGTNTRVEDKLASSSTDMRKVAYIHLLAMQNVLKEIARFQKEISLGAKQSTSIFQALQAMKKAKHPGFIEPQAKKII